MTQQYNRRPPGTPVGGQFSEATRAEAELDLVPPSLHTPGHVLPTPDQWQSRAERLRALGFVPPAALDASTADTRSARGAIREDVREDWWDRQHFTAERRHAEGDYPQMPDDNTPSESLGRSSSGKRRTHRMNYQGAGVSLRMPSATAIKRFAAQSNRKTFDVPVTAEYPGGSVQGWVRVTQGGDGQWETSGLNFTGSDDAYVAEGVRCVLEGKRPSHALAAAGDLIARRRSREVGEGAELAPANTSSWVSSVGRDDATGTTIITTKSGGKAYGWATNHAAFVRLSQSKSPGAVVNELKRIAPGVDMATCGKCGRVHRADVRHICPATPDGRDGQRFDANDRTVGRGLRAGFRRR